MSEIEKMQKYIKRTKMDIGTTSPYQLGTRQAFAVSDMPIIEAIFLAFNYGKAKGYRAAKAEVRA